MKAFTTTEKCRIAHKPLPVYSRLLPHKVTVLHPVKANVADGSFYFNISCLPCQLTNIDSFMIKIKGMNNQ